MDNDGMRKALIAGLLSFIAFAMAGPIGLGIVALLYLMGIMK